MKDINTCTFTGRLTRDSELKYLNSGTAVCNFSLAFSRSIKKGDSWEEKSCFIDCTLWDKRGESLSQYLTKGQQITITGELDHERWETDGQKRSKHKLIVSDLRLTSGKQENNSQPTESKSEDIPDDCPF